MARIAVLIPCYNEAHTIQKVVTDFKTVLPEAEVYVYDNNSNDGSDELARNVGAIVRYEKRQGKGNVIRSMFREVEADCYLMVDGDDTYSAENAREMIDAVLEKQVDMVIGDRLSSSYFTENKRPFHNTGNVLVRKLVNSIFEGDILDIMTGYRAFSWLFVKSFPVCTKGFEIETEMTIHALDKNFVVKSIPICYRDRPEGSVSKLNTVSDGIKVLSTIFYLFKDYRPLICFSGLAGIFMLAALLLFTPVWIEFVQSGLILRIPSLIVAGSFGVTAILLLMCGLILDTESKHARQAWEIQVMELKMIQSKAKNSFPIT